jgi:hypothetical protein
MVTSGLDLSIPIKLNQILGEKIVNKDDTIDPPQMPQEQSDRSFNWRSLSDRG